MANDPFVEIRGEVEREVVDILDAVATSERSNRMAVLRVVLRKWADAEIHRSSLIQRVRKGNGKRAESLSGSLPLDV